MYLKDNKILDFLRYIFLILDLKFIKKIFILFLDFGKKIRNLFKEIIFNYNE
jgi:hypothetical protein